MQRALGFRDCVFGVVGAGSDRPKTVRPTLLEEHAIGQSVRKSLSVSVHELAAGVVGQGRDHVAADYISHSVRWLSVPHLLLLKPFVYTLIMSVFFDTALRYVAMTRDGS